MSETYIDFLDPVPSTSGKTMIWQVVPRSLPDISLGEIRWYAQWRRYTFHPNGNGVYDAECLQVLTNFCADQTRQHRANRTRKES